MTKKSNPSKGASRGPCWRRVAGGATVKGGSLKKKWLLGTSGVGLTLLCGGPAYAEPAITPTSGPSGTVISVTDPDCRDQDGETITFGIVFLERVGSELVARSPQGGRTESGGTRTFGSSDPSLFRVIGPAGEYVLAVGCRSSNPVASVPETHFAFSLTDGPAGSDSGPAPAPASSPAAAPASGAPTAPVEGDQPEELVDATASQRQLDVAARNAVRQAEIAERKAARDAEIATRQASIADRQAERDAEIAARNAARQAALDARRAERAAR
jgi:hypothetical protein